MITPKTIINIRLPKKIKNIKRIGKARAINNLFLKLNTDFP